MFGIWTEIWTSRGSVEDLEDSEQLLRDSQLYSDKKRQSARVRRYPSWSLLLVAFFCTSIVSAAFGAWMAQFRRPDADAFCIPHISQYSPIVKDVGITYSPVKFNGSLLVSNDFRLDAGPQVDAAWKSLGVDYHAARIPILEAARSGLAPDQVKIREKYGGGYPAHVEGLHHLHCLASSDKLDAVSIVNESQNLLRKSLAWNFDYYQKQGLGPFSNDANILKHHITHCLDILRQQLMCTVDIGVLGQVWYQPPEKPLQAFVDFNTIHKCRNFDGVRQWAEQHQLPDATDTAADFLEPPKEGDRIWHTVP